MFNNKIITSSAFTFLISSFLISSCRNTTSESASDSGQDTTQIEEVQTTMPKGISEPLVTHIYTADPSAHVFDGKIYIYPSHDIDSQIPEKDDGSHFDMKDYHVFSMNSIGDEVVNHGVALDINDIPWAERQLWAPDAAYKGGTYYFYFPAKDKDNIFRIGVATGSSPAGPFKAQPQPIKGSYSIDPAVYEDNGSYYLYLGGIWGGQLQRWATGEYKPEDVYPADDAPALLPKVARLSANMLEFDEELRDVRILDENGELIKAGDHDRRFFEAAWVHKYNDKYYFSYSTGNTHFIAYAIGDNPYGPFTYQGNILNPVIGWTNHHSIVEFEGKWYLFYHDSTLSGGVTFLRNIKMTELTHNPDGTIQTIDPYIEQ